MNKVLIFAAALAIAFAGASLAADKGPAEMTLESTIDGAKTPKPATFPHAAHQEKFQCADCHHSKGDDGKQVAYVEGQEIAKCES
jgi:cytochrome c553